MALQLEYEDKYQLWTALIRGSTNRLFVATDATLKLWEQTRIEIRVGGLDLPVVVNATVIGRRGPSRA